MIREKAAFDPVRIAEIEAEVGHDVIAFLSQVEESAGEPARWLHLGLAVFGIAAYLTAEFAEHGARGAGYLVHAYLGLSLLAVMTVRLGVGLSDSEALGFRYWHLFSRTQWRAVAEDLASGRFDRICTRFPPEPNGYLHIGHSKSICLNFGLAEEYRGLCNLRFDDTNPTKEDVEYVDSIKEDVRWLGFDWDDRLYYASDYFE